MYYTCEKSVNYAFGDTERNKHKEIFRLFRDFWDRYLPARERGEDPPYVSFDCSEHDPK